MGFIAQDVEEVLPEIVETDSEGYKSINYTEIIPVMVEALKKQQQMIDKLQKSIDSLRRDRDSRRTTAE